MTMDVLSKENRAYVCRGLSMLADAYMKQSTKAEDLGDEHTKAHCRKIAAFLVLELRPHYGALDGFGDELTKKLKKLSEGEKDPRQLDLSPPGKTE